ncbi:hypothetical protein [Roseivirga misakiensis]|uniref:Fructose 1,6-bisphosphatase n=1 Tax=Roseivirga misakiensis TaxID=1563681 RepID=A0A1E5T6I1_9BACT|nr:hypothetical protein [Roseivirga misakiensis]OEK06958.1 hypothetical protein BFP71_04690 [Roseivirga misakiensis]
MAKQKEEQAPQGTGVDPKIEAVKQLIFGENMQQYDSEFNEIKALIKKTRTDVENEINDTRDALNKLINQTKESLTNDISDLRSDMNKKVTQLRSDMDDSVADLDERKVNRKLLGTMLQEMGKQIAE